MQSGAGPPGKAGGRKRSRSALRNRGRPASLPSPVSSWRTLPTVLTQILRVPRRLPDPSAYLSPAAGVRGRSLWRWVQLHVCSSMAGGIEGENRVRVWGRTISARLQRTLSPGFHLGWVAPSWRNPDASASTGVSL